MAAVETEKWDLIIEPRRSLLDLRLGELWQCRDLISLFVWRDFVSVYKQTILGPLWHIIQPLLTTLTFTLIFGQVAQLSTDGAPQSVAPAPGSVQPAGRGLSGLAPPAGSPAAARGMPGSDRRAGFRASAVSRVVYRLVAL